MATACVRVKYVQYNTGGTGTTGEGFCGTGDVLFSYQTVSHACSLIRSAPFVWSRPEWWLVYTATRSYRICRQKRIFHAAAGGSPFLAISNSFYFTGLEMSQSMYGNCCQAGAALCLFLLVDKRCIKLLWWAGEEQPAESRMAVVSFLEENRLQPSCLHETRSVSAWWEMENINNYEHWNAPSPFSHLT